MTALDSDILSEIFFGKAFYVEKAQLIPRSEIAISIVVYEEAIRGRLATIERTETRKSKSSMVEAYTRLAQTIESLARFHLILYSEAADRLVQDWRNQKLDVRLYDMRIAASCIAANARLI